MTLLQLMVVVVLVAVGLAPWPEARRSSEPGAYLVATFLDLAVVPAVASVALSLLVKDRTRRRKSRAILWAVLAGSYLAVFVWFILFKYLN